MDAVSMAEALKRARVLDKALDGEQQVRTYRCPDCDFEADVPLDFEASVACTVCVRRKARVGSWRKVLAYHGVPERYAMIPESLDVPREIEGWIAKNVDPWCLTLVGPNGVGKTWAATWAFGKALMGGVDLRRDEDETPSELRPRWDDVSWAVESMRREIESPIAYGTFERMCRCRLLLLDDFAAMRDTDYGRERVRLIIKARYDNLLPTIVTSDRPLTEIEKRLASRMSEVGSRGSAVITMTGQDRRL